MQRKYSSSLVWNRPTLLENSEDCFKRDNELLYLPLFYIWNLWISWNLYIFEEKILDLISLCFKIKDQFISYPVIHNKKTRIRNIGNAPVFSYPTGFFYGVAVNQRGGDHIYLLISQTHFFYINLGCGHNSNKRDELLALWALLYFSK